MDVIQDRLPVWEALSEFFLDTELDEDDYQRISSVLAASPYPQKDIADILRFEVYPILIWNLRSIAGEWAYFDREWLQEQITPKLNRRPKIRIPLHESDQSLNTIYDKIFHGCNLPSITHRREPYAPSWSGDELDAMREHMKIGFSVFQRAIDTPRSKEAEQDVDPNT